MSAKNLVFCKFSKIFAKYLIACFAKFSWNFAKFCKIQNNFVKISCFAKFLQCCFAATLCRGGGGRGGGGVGSGGGRHVLPCAPSMLTQIVPISASVSTVFHSVIFNSVR